jgi:hypothetical protein
MSTMASSEPVLRCARHPSVETVLRCGRCETPICPKCLVATPVGARCPTCARVKRFALLLKPLELARSIGFALGVAAIGALIFTYLSFLGLIGLALLGFLVGEAASIGANRKRAPELGPIVVACLFVGCLLVFGIGALANRLVLIGLLLGALLAWMRVR